MMLIILLLIIAIIILYYYVKSTSIYKNFEAIRKFSNTLPGPKFTEMLQNVKNENNILDWFLNLKERYGRIFCLWMGKDLVVIITSPDDAKEVLQNNKLLYKSNNYQFLSSWLGMGLLTNGGESWHRRRKMLTPAFHFKILETFKPSMEINCDILINNLREKSRNNEEFDIYPYITLFALDVICETAMGIKKNAQLQSESEYVLAVQEICKILHKQQFTAWQRFSFLFNRSKACKARDAALKILHEETYRVINLRRVQLNKDMKQLINNEKIEEMQTKTRLAFLDMLLIAQNNGAELTDVDIREEVDTFMFEGHDTTSSTISFAIYLLSQNKEIQQRAYEESIEFDGREKEPMKYLEACIKETLRLYPAVPFFGRLVTEETFIGNIKLPKGCAITISPYIVHRDANEFPNAEKFIPERHLNNDKEHNPFSFIGFSAGPRNCIGQKFAILELKCTLSKLLRAYEFLPVKNFSPKLLPELVLKSANGIKIKLKSRE